MTDGANTSASRPGSRAWFDGLVRRLQQINALPDPNVKLRLLQDMHGEVMPLADAAVKPEMLVAGQVNYCSSLVNAAGDAVDMDALVRAAEVAHRIAASPGISPTYRRWALYNQANATAAITDIRASTMLADPNNPTDWRAVRWDLRSDLTKCRRLFRKAADVDGPNDLLAAAMAHCNLANTLDVSGRWLEAYDHYVAALGDDPTNGNAAGNAALLLKRVADSGWGNRRHLYGLYDRYLKTAHALRDRTVEIAGERAARLFDDLELSGADHAGDEHEPLDEYQGWVLDHRLALTPALEGVGHLGSQWDDATVTGIRTPFEQDQPPEIITMMNLLKSDYLVARRTLYRAELMLEDAPTVQHDDDPGRYTSTQDTALYGEPTAMIVLAQRAALDVLDKIAVAVNEHFEVGDRVKDIYFMKFWTERAATTPATVKLRSKVLNAMPGCETFVLSMAELTVDMASDGMYGKAKAMRHAGTHRFALLSQEKEPSRASVDSFTVSEARQAAYESMSVARAAYLYLAATVNVFESKKSGPTIDVSLGQQSKAAPALGDGADETDE